MQVTWSFSSSDVAACRKFISDYADRQFVKDRKRLNVRRIGIDLSSETAWRTLIGCFVTTQQRSDSRSRVSQFLNSESALLDLNTCLTSKDIATLTRTEITKAGLRRAEIISGQVAYAVEQFRGKSWKTLAALLDSIRTYPTLRKEREVAADLRKMFKGLGPKQSRNYIQWIGLSRYVVPLDSRFAKYLQSISFPVPVSVAGLQDEDYYRFVEDGIQEFTTLVGCYPCMLDASVFSSFKG